MDIHLLVSLDFHEKLKCCVCKNYLSYFPISVCSNNESVCGRCTVPQGRVSYQDVPFQTICQFLKFPCRYQSEGCPEELEPKYMPWHEENCAYRVVPCFINRPTPCIWKGSLPTLIIHCQTQHSDVILKNGEFQMDLALSETTDNLIEYDKQLLIFSRKFKPKNKMLECAVYHIPYQTEVESCACKLSVTSDNMIVSVNFKTTSYKEMIFQSLCLKSISSGNDTVRLCKVNIGEADQCLRICSETNNSQLLSLLKCSECSHFAVPPIYQCSENMNTLCSVCKRSHFRSSRPCTKSKNNHLRNLHLKRIAELVYYPCNYQQNGCLRSYKYEPLPWHHELCKYRDDTCPFFDLCRWKGLNKDVCDHVVNSHEEIILESSEVALVLSLEMKTPQCKIIRFSNRLFRLAFCVDEDERYMWSVEMIGCYEKGFKFAIDIVDSNGNRLLKSQDCWRLSKKDDLFKNTGNEYCYFLNDQIRGFARKGNGQVTFKVHIFK